MVAGPPAARRAPRTIEPLDTPPPPRFGRYVALGDSSTEGLEDPDGAGGWRGWADRLAERLAELQGSVLYANLGVRGRRTAQVRAEQLAPACALRPDLATVFTGTNDVIARRFDAGRVAEDVEAMLAALSRAGATVLVLTLPDLGPVMPLARPLAPRVRALNAAVRAAARRTGAVLADLAAHPVAHDRRLWCGDRLHANPMGHARMAAALAHALALPGSDEAWSHALPSLPPEPAARRLGAELAWVRGHLLPWVWGHLRGRSPDEGLGPKRPELRELRAGRGEERPARRAAARGAALALAFLLAAAAPAPAAASAGDAPRAAETAMAVTESVAAWPFARAVTTLRFDEVALGRLGLRLVRVEPSAATPPQHPLSFVPPGQPAFRGARPGALRARVADGTVRAFAGGPVAHRGGFALAGPARDFDFRGFALRAGARRFSLELLDAAGTPMLVAVQPWFDLDPATGALRYVNADLRVLPALARRLGDPRLAGMTIGTLELHGTLRVGAMPRRTALLASATTPPPCGDFGGQVDVALIDMDAVQQAGEPEAGRIVVVPSVTLENVGTANVPWYSKFSGEHPPFANDQHPYLVWQMLRLHEGVLEPLGRNDLKHAFATANIDCDPGACGEPNSHVLGLGCKDPYNVGSNTWLSALGPRSEVTASTGVWAHCDEPAPGTASHLDPDGDCDQDPLPGEDLHTHGMKVAQAALGLAGARYFVEAFYVVREDLNVVNSMGYREVTPTLGSSWTFPFAGGFAQGPAIDSWVDPTAPGPGADNRLVDTGTGRVQVAVRVSDLGSGRRRFAYAVQNHDFDRKVASFRVPFDTGGVSSLAFVDGDASAANDWTAAVDASGITWTAPAGAELDWGTLFAFRYESGRPFTELAASLAAHEPGPPGAPDVLEVRLCNRPGPCFADGFESGGTAAWAGRQPD